MYVCMYVCVYVRMYASMYTCMYVCMYVSSQRWLEKYNQMKYDDFMADSQYLFAYLS